VIDKELHRAHALLVEGNAMLRGVTAAQLRDCGVGQVTSAGRIRDARLLLERSAFDIVVCSRDFEGTEDTGQDLLDELRRERLLPASTVFLMVTSRATYHQVVEAAEATLDGILVRPYNAVALGQRLVEARLRKRELAEVLHALDAGQTEAALVRAVRRFGEKAPYWVYCGRLAAELMLVLGRPGDAGRLFEKLHEVKPTAWSRLGMSRARLAAGDVGEARQIVQAVVAKDPGCADGHDLLGRILVEQCEFDTALEEYRAAVALTPGCLLRQQHTGALAFYQGHADEALAHLEHAVSLGERSSLFDALTLLLIAMLRFDRRDGDRVTQARAQLHRYRQRFPASGRLARFVASADALHEALCGGEAAARANLEVLAAEVPHEDFDLEAGAMLLALARRLPGAFESPPDYEHLVQRIGHRFSVSRAITEVLVAASGRSHPASGILRACHGHVSSLAEQALDDTLHGDPGGAIERLLEQGEELRNMRLLDLARSLIRRHPTQIDQASGLPERAAALVRRYGRAVNHIAGIQRCGRAPGAMQVRGLATSAAPAAPAATGSPRSAPSEPGAAPLEPA
jgi:predicted Zn-dependent protease